MQNEGRLKEQSPFRRDAETSTQGRVRSQTSDLDCKQGAIAA